MVTNLIEYTLGVDGMKCGMCESHVNDVVRKVEGVKKVTSSHMKNNCVIVMEEACSKDAIKEAITKQGYRILSEEEKPYVKKTLFSIFKK